MYSDWGRADNCAVVKICVVFITVDSFAIHFTAQFFTCVLFIMLCQLRTISLVVFLAVSFIMSVYLYGTT